MTLPSPIAHTNMAPPPALLACPPEFLGADFSFQARGEDKIKMAAGCKILEVYTKGEKYTPEQNKLIATISIIASSVLIMVGVILSIIFLSLPPLAFVAIPIFLIVGVGTTFWYLNTRQTDLDRPTVREQVIKDVASLTFEELRRQQSPENVVGYNLLQTSLEQQADQKDASAKFYLKFSILNDQFDNLTKEHSEVLKKIESAYETTIADSRKKFELAKARILQVNSALSQRNAGGANVSNELMITGLKLRYDNEIEPANKWKTEHLSRLQTAFNNAKQLIEIKFLSLKSNATSAAI